MTNVESKKLAEELFPACWKEVTQHIHLVVPASAKSLDAVLETVGKCAGVFGDYPLYDSQGSHYLEPEDGRIIDDFSLWKNPRNQELVRTLGACEKLSGFTMVISAETSREMLIKMYDLSPRSEYDGELDYNLFIRAVPKWIIQLGWAYVPIAGGDDLALFIVSGENKNLVSTVGQRIKAAGGKTAILHEIRGLPRLRFY